MTEPASAELRLLRGSLVGLTTRHFTFLKSAVDSLRLRGTNMTAQIEVSGIDIRWQPDRGTCTFEELPVAMMWVGSTLAGLMSGVQTMVGTERFGLAMQSQGRKSVEDDWQVISQFPDFPHGFAAIADIAAVAGWGQWKLLSLDTTNKECRFRATDSWEGLYQKALGVCWGSSMLAGKLAGYCTKLFETNCWAEQTVYIAQGHTYDEFVVRPSARSLETEIDRLLATDQASRADMAVALNKLQAEVARREQTEQQLETLLAELEAKNAELERFTYTVSHDLRSPLITIKGFTGLLRKDLASQSTDKVHDDLRRIDSAADRMEQLLRELLELSRIGRSVNPSEEVPLTELAHEATESIAGRVARHPVQFDISPDLPIVFGDRVRLLEVLQNLIDNAFKYRRARKRLRIEIGSRRSGGTVICFVRDNGIGIDPRYHEEIFGLFEKLDPKTEGTGIGLALVKRIVEAHRGRIWVESDGPGHGATFCFSIPERQTTENRRTDGPVAGTDS